MLLLLLLLIMTHACSHTRHRLSTHAIGTDV